MSIHLEIPDSLFARIQKNAVPFVDLTPIAVLERWADHFEKAPLEPRSTLKADSSLDVGRKINPLSAPDLMHTRCRGTFADVPFRKWNELVRVAHIQAFSKNHSFDALKSITHAQIRKGDHSGNSGYHFVPEIGISVQGVDANHAWAYALHLARYLKLPVQVFVEWRQNDKAAYPGESGLLEWRP